MKNLEAFSERTYIANSFSGQIMVAFDVVDCWLPPVIFVDSSENVRLILR